MGRLLGHSGPVLKLVTAMEILSTSLSWGMEKAFISRKITPQTLLSPKSKKRPVFEHIFKWPRSCSDHQVVFIYILDKVCNYSIRYT